MKYLLDKRKGAFLRASISDVCNFSCQYCPKDLGMENHTPICLDAPLLSAQDYLCNMKMIAEHGFVTISFTGGEPLLNPEFPEILKGCRNLFRTIELTTNGTQLPKYQDIIRENVDVLKISLDSCDRELGSKIAGNSLAYRTMDIIEQTCRKGQKTVGINFVYMKQNQEELSKVVDFASNLKKKYGTDIYISILDLYYSKENRSFWREQFVDLADLRRKIEKEGHKLNHRIRVGCDSYNFAWKDVVVNMKDSISCTHRDKICEACEDYCQEGIYSLKHSASGWISVCPSNKLELGDLLDHQSSVEVAHQKIDKYIEILNRMERVEQSGTSFLHKNELEVLHG